MTLNELATWAGLIASLAGLLLAAAQTIRLRDLKRRTKADIWHAIAATLSLINNLEKSKLIESNKGAADSYKGATDLYRHLLRIAILEEPSFDEETIRKWRSTGKLATEWQEIQARRLIDTTNISKTRRESSQE